MSLFQHLPPDYQEKVLKRWSKVLSAGGKIVNESTALATALVLENTQREFEKGGVINEANTTGGIDVGGALNPSTPAFGLTDMRIPSIVIPTVRRIFPELVAHDLVGVQPMNGPAGFAFALRALYGKKGNTSVAATGKEIGYNYVDSSFTGASGNMANEVSGNYSNPDQVFGGTGSSAVSTGSAYWQAFNGNPNTFGSDQTGMGETLGNSEWWKIGTDMPMASFRLEKGIVEAKSRKLATNFSLELAEDMQNVHGINVDNEMVNVMSYEIQSEIDRQLLTEMVKAAISYNKVSTWSPVSADGRNQMERIGTIYTQLLIKSQQVAIETRRGPANWAVASPTVVALLERVSDFTLDAVGDAQSNSHAFGVAKVGTLRKGSIKLYRDTLAGGDYVLMGYKGQTAYDSGCVYCPYVPLQILRAQGQDDFTPRIGVRTRYGVLNNLFGTGRYYHFMKVDGLASAALAADGSRVFTY